MTTVAALFGALPLMLGTGTGSELRHPLGISIVGGLLVSQVLTLFTTPVIYLCFDRLARAAAAPGGGAASATRRGADADEPLDALHPPAGRHHAADARAGAGRRGRLLPAAGVAAAAGRSSRPSRSRRSMPGASPETMATSVATPLERHLGAIADVTEMTSHELGRLDAHHAAVRPQPRHRRRGARRAGGDQRGARRSADSAARPTRPTARSIRPTRRS